MFNRHMQRYLAVSALLALNGCVTMPTGPSVLVMPAQGKPFDVFQSEVGKCRQWADSRMGKFYDYYSSQEAQFYYDNAYIQCMISHGNQIPRPARMYRSTPATPSVPPPGTPPPEDY